MKSNDDPWLKSAHEHAELLDGEIRSLAVLAAPIRENSPLITKYQDFWSQAKRINRLFKELKPLVQGDRVLLWNRFNHLCEETREKQKSEYGTLETLSQGHLDAILQHVELARFPKGLPVRGVTELMGRGQALKDAGELLGKFKHEMIARHKKTCFDRIQEVRKTHDAAWEPVRAEKPKERPETKSRIRKNLEENYERREKAENALENFQIGRGHLCTFIASCKDPEKLAVAKARLAETEARIKDIEDGILQLKMWIAEDERRLDE